jgi:hypothetical protein
LFRNPAIPAYPAGRIYINKVYPDFGSVVFCTLNFGSFLYFPKTDLIENSLNARWMRPGFGGKSPMLKNAPEKSLKIN